MPLTIKEAARTFNIPESRLRNYIVSGKLPVTRKGRQILISESDLEGLFRTEKEELQDAPCDKFLNRLDANVQSVARDVLELKEMLPVLEHVREAIRQKERELAEKTVEIEKLKRDLLYQQRLHKKELEDQRQMLQEKWSLMEKELAERIARERAHFEYLLSEEKRLWSEKLAREQELFSQKLTQMTQQEGFWARLIKMITWS